jgi:hypothetical protein
MCLQQISPTSLMEDEDGKVISGLICLFSIVLKLFNPKSIQISSISLRVAIKKKIVQAFILRNAN